MQCVSTVVSVHRPCSQDRHHLLCRFAVHGVRCIFFFRVPAAIVACWQVILQDRPTRDIEKSTQSLKKFSYNIRTSFCLSAGRQFSLPYQFHWNVRMSKASTTSVPKIPAPLPAKSAWSRGPPQSTTTPSSRSQSPAPSGQLHQTHSRRSSTLGQAVPVKDGVSVSRGNVGAFKPSESYGIDLSLLGFNLMYSFQVRQ